MTKAELVNEIIKRTGVDVTPSDVVKIIEAEHSVIVDTMAKGESVFIRGFATFTPALRAEKTGRNILKGTTVIIPARYSPKATFVNRVRDKVQRRSVFEVPPYQQ